MKEEYIYRIIRYVYNGIIITAIGSSIYLGIRLKQLNEELTSVEKNLEKIIQDTDKILEDVDDLLNKY